ncbi:MAG: circadian clock KaiB family protein [Rhodospirillales bacterium]
MRGPETKIKLSLYGAEGSHSTARAWANVTRILEQLDPDIAELEFVDVMRDPERTFDDGVLVSPTLVVAAGGQRRVIVGTLEAPYILEAILKKQAIE